MRLQESLLRWRSRIPVAIAAALCLGAASAAADAPRTPQHVVTGSWQVLEDPGGDASLLAVIARADRFRPAASAAPNFGFTHSAYWFRLPVENRADRPALLYLKSDNVALDEIVLHVVAGGSPRAMVRSGDRVAPGARPHPGAPLVLPFELRAHESAQLYVRVRAEAGVMLVPFALLDAYGLAQSLLARNVIEGITTGVFLMLFLYNLVLLLLLRERAYLYYVCYLLFAYLGIIGTTGFATHVLFPHSAWFTNEGLIAFSGLSLLSILLFTRTFLQLHQHPRLDSALRALVVVAAAQTASPLLLPIQTVYQLTAFTLGITPLVSAAIGAVVWRQGRREAMLFTLAHVAGCTGLVVYLLMYTGVIAYAPIMFQIVPAGLTAAALLHAFALSHRIRLLQDDKISVETEMRRNLEMHKNDLERLVAERTAALERARARAERLATTDPLTGIYNRRGLFDLAERQLKLALRQDQPLAVIIFDLDRFKSINDSYGHAEGDRVLCDVVATAREAIRDVDLFGRTGGDEFFVVLPGATREQALDIAERLRRHIEAQVRYGDASEAVNVSVGAACLSARINNLDRLETAADEALYRAKRNGRNRVELEDGRLRTA